MILILAGKGNNGNDARAAQEYLDGRKVELLEAGVPENALPGLELALRQKPALIIDGLFGIGLNRPLDDSWKKFIGIINQSKIPVLAVDVPSGLNADTGENFGATIEAAITLTIGAPKVGLLAPSAWPFVGRLEVADDVGLIACPSKGELNWILPEDFSGFPPHRAAAGHKGSFGHLAILAGSFGFHGAGVLAARGAQTCPARTRHAVHAGIGLSCCRVAIAVSDGECLAAGNETVRRRERGVDGGPGLAVKEPTLIEELKALTRRLWRDLQLPLVVDASALDWVASHGLPASLIRVVTPHPGRGGADAQYDRAQGAGESSAGVARNLQALWQLLGGVERPSKH